MTDPDARVTVLVVAYNHAPYIRQCLDSVRAQDAASRVVVIDDASPDGTGGVVADLVEELALDATVVRHTENVGLGPSLSEGLSLVDTPFVAYIAGDDWMEPHRISTQLAEFDRLGPQCALVYSDCFRADVAGARLEPKFSVMHASVWTPDTDDLFAALVERNWIPAPTVMVRTSCLRAVGGYDPDIAYEDHDVFLRLAREWTFSCIAEPLATHRELADSLGVRLFWESPLQWNWERVKVYRKHLDRDRDLGGRISGRLRDWGVEAYVEGRRPSEVAELLTLVAPHRPHDRMMRAYLVLARAGVPGRWVGTARRVIRGRPGGRRRGDDEASTRQRSDGQ